MARVTVEDCITKIPNRFELVLLATQRARELASGAFPTIARDNDKNPVIALREIAEETVKTKDLYERLLASLRRQEYGFSSEETHDADLVQVMQNEETSYLQEDSGLKIVDLDPLDPLKEDEDDEENLEDSEDPLEEDSFDELSDPAV